MISVSIVSHRNGADVARLVRQLVNTPLVHEVFVLLNVPEDFDLLPYSKVTYISNTAPRGFGENHNYVSTFACGEFFLILNPDIFFDFESLTLEHLGIDFAVASPQNTAHRRGVVNLRFDRAPTFSVKFSSLFGRFLGGFSFHKNKTISQEVVWLPGCFQLWRYTDFVRLGGFDQAFFMYYEDVDICLRARKFGMIIIVFDKLFLKHEGAYSSRVNILLFFHHVKSLILFNCRYYLGRYR